MGKSRSTNRTHVGSPLHLDRFKQSAHRNGITKPKGNKYASMKGVDPKFRRNARFAAQGSQKAVREARAAKAE
ncbi:60S ribosomal protein L29 [Naganishia friedmannii]|uniref:60S ribosomal protein L29 n=1 Tax=Naganishia friedmannii TaxID=89922 RepID=A0ACC2VF48_9TREE|nr:60S ribosomal protein L29 [Naganishia friedmannii]